MSVLIHGPRNQGFGLEGAFEVPLCLEGRSETFVEEFPENDLVR
jgi:hypothetical protein